MENEILLQILSELKSLNVRQGNVEEKLSNVEKKVSNIEDKVNNLEDKVNNVEDKVSNIEVRQNQMAEELVAFQEFAMEKFERIENRLGRVELSIENVVKPSIQALAEGHMQMQVQLDRIEDKVTSHEEIIFKRVK